MVTHSLLAMFALSLCAGHAMSMKGRMGTSLVLSAKPGTRDTKVKLRMKFVVYPNVMFYIL
jgi:hypothetical protein